MQTMYFISFIDVYTESRRLQMWSEAIHEHVCVCVHKK